MRATLVLVFSLAAASVAAESTLSGDLPRAADAPLEVIDADFKSTPLGWAIHGSEHGWHCRTGDYPATVEALLRAGAKILEKLGGSEAVRGIGKRRSGTPGARARHLMPTLRHLRHTCMPIPTSRSPTSPSRSLCASGSAVRQRTSWSPPIGGLIAAGQERTAEEKVWFILYYARTERRPRSAGRWS